jgi:ESF2/ABP1 family protein
VAESLNNTCIGGKKSDYYHDDIWNLKYLNKFKWEYLTEKLAYERRVREMKMKATMAQSKKTNAEMKQLIEQTKVQEIIHQRKKVRAVEDGTGDIPRQGLDSNRMKRRFKQHQSLGTEYDDKDNRVNKTLLNSIFSQSEK